MAPGGAHRSSPEPSHPRSGASAVTSELILKDFLVSRSEKVDRTRARAAISANLQPDVTRRELAHTRSGRLTCAGKSRMLYANRIYGSGNHS